MGKPLSAYFNILRMRLAMRRGRTRVRHHPIMAQMDPVLLCNLRCPACPTGLRLNQRPGGRMPWERFREFLDEHGRYLFRLKLYNFGEPLLHKDTPEMLAYAKSFGIRCEISTNLSLELSDDYLERLVRSGLDLMTVSVDGTSQETYERYRRRGEFALVRRNLERIRAIKERLGIGSPWITWQFLVFRHNEHEIEVIRENYKKWGADALVVAPAQLPVGEHREGFEPSTIPEFVFSPEGPPVAAEQDEQTAPADTAAPSLPEVARPEPCSWLHGAMVLNGDGMVSPCCATSDSNDDFGEFVADREAGRDVWNSASYQRARAVFEPGSQQEAAPDAPGDLICSRCPMPTERDLVTRLVHEVRGELLADFRENRSVGSLVRFALTGALL